MNMRTGLFAAVFLVTACNAPTVQETDPTAEKPVAIDEAPFARTDYTDTRNWLCHPDMSEGNACDLDLSATIIHADGTTELEQTLPADAPAFDCFYIYPTVSLDEGPNSDLLTGLEELNVIANQFARYGKVCRQFAPLYRQTTLAELRRRMTTGQTTTNAQMRYADVEDAWKTYLRDYNDGRGVVLIGHSQGSGMLAELVPKAILGTPAADQIISVHALGATLPVNTETGRAFGLPLCETGTQTGCLVSFVSFRSTSPPAPEDRFGKADGDQRAVCNSPSALIGHGSALNAYLPRKSIVATAPYEYGAAFDTEFVKLPGLLSGTCQTNADHDWLAVTVNADPGDARADDIPGDVKIEGTILKDWGLHLIDVNLVMGDLIDLADQQAEAWQEAH